MTAHAMRSCQAVVQIKRLAAALVYAAVLWPGVLPAEPVAVRYTEGALHGFLALRTLDDELLADGDFMQATRGDRVTAHLVFHFKDGSTLDETAVYSQDQRFQLISDDLVQKGPAFPNPISMSIDGVTGQVTVHYEDEHGEQKSETEHVDIPPDLANGIIPKLLMNSRSDMMPKTISLIAATPKPRLVRLAITTAAPEQFSIGGSVRQATHYVLKAEIGGVSSVLASILGKQPPDSHVWMLDGDVPAFLRSEQSLYLGGPMCRIELASPIWAKAPIANRKHE